MVMTSWAMDFVTNPAERTIDKAMVSFFII
jgi:hypothetical protein